MLSTCCVGVGSIDRLVASIKGSGDGRSDGIFVFLFDVGAYVGESGVNKLSDVSLAGDVDGIVSDEGGFGCRVRVKSCTLHRSLVKHVSPYGHSFPVGQCDSIEHFTLSHVSPQNRMLPGWEVAEEHCVTTCLAIRTCTFTWVIVLKTKLTSSWIIGAVVIGAAVVGNRDGAIDDGFSSG